MPNTRTLRCFLDRLKTAHLGMGTAFWCWCPPSTRSGRARPGMNNNSARSEHQACLKKIPIKVNKSSNTYILTAESPRTWNADSARNRWEHLLSHRLTPRRTSSSLRFTHLMKRILGSLVKATALQKSQYHCNLLLVMYRSVPKKNAEKKRLKKVCGVLWLSTKTQSQGPNQCGLQITMRE